MSDLSNLLGSVYGDRDPDAAPVHHEPPAADRPQAWDDDARLDEAFRDWTPGPGPDAPAHEREMLAERSHHVPASDPDQDLAAALSAALAAETRSEPAPAPAAPAPTMPPAAPQMMAPPVAAAPAPMAPVMPAMPAEAPMPAPQMVPAMAGGAPQMASWQFGDDDIYPLGRRGKKR